MILSKRSNGIYYVIYNKPNGKRTRISTKTKIKVEAIRFLSNFEKEIEQRKQQRLVSVSFVNFSNQFLDNLKSIHTLKTQKAYKSSMDSFQKHFGNISLKEINYEKMNEYFKKRIESNSIYQARKDYICINSLFNKALATGLILGNPCREIKPFRIPQKQPLFFTELEIDLLLSKVPNEDLKDLIVFAIQTGLRQMELITLEWSQINFKERYLILDNRQHLTKSKKVRTVPLTLKALQVITKRQLTNSSGLIFIYNNKPITQSFITHKFKEYVLAAKLNPSLNFHSLRHTFASWLVQKGATIYEVQKLLGHSSVSVTEIYSHLRSEDLRSAVDKLNN